MLEKPRYCPVGELRLLVELSDQVELVANLKAISLVRQLLPVCPLGPSGIEAIVDLVPSFNTVLIEYEPNLLMQQGFNAARFDGVLQLHISAVGDATGYRGYLKAN